MSGSAHVLNARLESLRTARLHADRLGSQRLRSTDRALLVASTAMLASVTILCVLSKHYGLASAAAGAGLWTFICLLVRSSITQHHFRRFGLANSVTLTRALATTLLASLIPVASQVVQSDSWLWAVSVIATVSLCLDGLDGYLARKKNLVSVFGARFDMEIDALLSLVIVLFLWQSGELGVWVLTLGLMRYVFLAASIWLPALKEELYPSLRRKAICVIQVGALCLMICPLLNPIQVFIVGLAALGLLLYSFAVDTLWLLRQGGSQTNT